MDSAALAKPEQTQEQLARRLEAGQAELASRYGEVLRQTLFTGRSAVRPKMLGRIAAAEFDALLDYFRHPLPATAQARGAQQSQTGLGEQTVLLLGRATRRFLLADLDPEVLVAALGLVDAFHEEVLQGFLRDREKVILSEQERIRSALQRTLGRYTIQMEVAAEVAGATTSILDLSALLQTAVELIRERFELYYVGIFLVEDDGLSAMLRAGTGEASGQALAHNARLQVGGGSLIGACIASGQAQVALEVSDADLRRTNTLLPDTNSAAAIPLISRGGVIGALTVQSRRVAAFSELDVTVLRILGNQLANAIANARLFSELGHSEEKYRTILQNIEEGYYEIDSAGAFTFVNDSMSSLLGFSKEAILGASYGQFVDADDVDKVAEAFAAVYGSGNPARVVEYRIVRHDKTSRVIETSASVLRDEAGKAVGLRGLVRDITRRKQDEQLVIERKALERKALERSNRELEQFAFVASHDLQEPLRKILTFGDRLKDKYAEQLSSEGGDYLQRMLTAAGRMQSLINDLLTLSRVATQAQPFARVNLGQVAAEVASDLEALVDQTGGRVEFGELPTIDADPIQMRQLLQNLIGNGLKFHRPDAPPVVIVTSSPLEERRGTRDLSRDMFCQIVIEDNGIGFDPKYLGRIFEPFQRLHGLHEYAGTGIGLTICHRIVDRHGGHITARSALNAGATFIVSLPVRQSSAGVLS